MKIHYALFVYTCFGREWQRDSIKRTKVLRKITCKNCRRDILRSGLSPRRKAALRIYWADVV